MPTSEFILRKRDGEELSAEDITALIDGYTNGEIPDHQMAAFLMAVYFSGMDERESVVFHDLFLFKQTGVGPNHEVIGYYTATGRRPTFLDELRARGVKIDDELFRPQEAPVRQS